MARFPRFDRQPERRTAAPAGLSALGAAALALLSGCAPPAPAQADGAGGSDPDAGAAVALEARALPPGDELLDRLAPELAGALRTARGAAVAGGAPELAQLARLLEAHDLPSQAREVYDRLLDVRPADPRANFHAALCDYELGQAERAAAQLAGAIELSPDRAPGHWRAGLWLAEAGELEAARAAFERARAADPSDVSGILGRARTELDLGDPALALELAAPLAGLHPYAAHLRARALTALGRPAEAQVGAPSGEAYHDWYDPWIAELDELRIGRGADLGAALDAIRAGRTAEAVARLEALLGERPDDVTVQGMLAAAHASRGAPEAALPMLREAAERQPRHYRIALNTAINLQAAGRVEEALGEAARAVSLHPEHAPARYLLGRLAEATGDRELAIESYRAALRLGFERRQVAPRLIKLGLRPEEVGQ